MNGVAATDGKVLFVIDNASQLPPAKAVAQEIANHSQGSLDCALIEDQDALSTSQLADANAESSSRYASVDDFLNSLRGT